MSCLLAIDQGTTSSRSILFGSDGQPIHSAQREFQQHFPQPGWVEHDPEEIWRSQVDTARQVMAAAGELAGAVEAIGITNQRETTLVWERATGRPLYRAIVWQDRRVAERTDRLRADGLEPTIRRKTGLVLDPYFSAGKLEWLLDNVPDLRRRAEAGEVCFGTVDSWLIFQLTGGRVHVTDVSNASRTLLYDIRNLAWDDELLGLFRIPRAVLPRVVPSSGVVGETDPELFGRSIPIAGVAGDQQAALFGQACFEAGMAKNTYGTGAFVVMNTGEHLVFGEGVLTTVAWQLGDRRPCYALEGSIFVAGAAVQWLRDGLGIIDSAAEVEQLAAGLPDNGDVYFVPALTGLGAPHWDPHARGLIAGITRGTTRAHLARAALEAMAYQTADAIRAMSEVSRTPLQELRVDGGAAANNWLLQFQADLLDTPVVRPSVTETTALGAAYLAAVGTGLLQPAQIAERWVPDRGFAPAMDSDTRRRLCQDWSRAVERARAWAGEPPPPPETVPSPGNPMPP